MSKNIKRNIKDVKEGTEISLKETSDALDKYRARPKENLNFELIFFSFSISILISTNIYIHKTVIPLHLIFLVHE